jgi:hypothetical protein
MRAIKQGVFLTSTAVTSLKINVYAWNFWHYFQDAYVMCLQNLINTGVTDSVGNAASYFADNTKNISLKNFPISWREF